MHEKLVRALRRASFAGRVFPWMVLASITVLAVVSRRASRERAQGAHLREEVPPVKKYAPPRKEVPPPLALSGALPEGGGSAPTSLHGGPRRTHRAVGRFPKASHVRWVFDAEAPVHAQVVSSRDEQELFVATLGGKLFRLSRGGDVRAAVSLGERMYGTPLWTADGTVYATTDAKALVALSPEGKIRWRFGTEGEADTSPVELPSGAIAVSAGNSVYALKKSGDLLFRFRAKGKIFASPAVTPKGLLVLGSQDNRVYALTDAGGVAWSSDLGADVDGAPVVGEDGAVFVGTDKGEIVKFSEEGAVLWRSAQGGFVRGPLSLSRNGDVFAGVFGPTAKEVRVRSEDGQLLGAWVVGEGVAKEFGVFGGALEDSEGAMGFGAQDDHAYVVNHDGTERFRLKTDGDVDAPLTLLSDGTLLVASEGGKVYCLSDPP